MGVAVVGSWQRHAWIPLAVVTAVLAIASMGQQPTNRLALPDSMNASLLETREYGSALDGVTVDSEFQPSASSPDVIYAAQGRRLPADDATMAGVNVRDLELWPTGVRLAVEAPQASVLRLQSFYFPGWRA